MSADQDWSRRQSRNFQTLALPPQDIPDKRSFFNPAMNPRLLECFNRRRLSVGEPRFCAPFREYPTPAAAGFDQQELDRASADPVADRSDLFALAYFDYLRKSNALGERLTVQNN
jgi:hypothetical protein